MEEENKFTCEWCEKEKNEEEMNIIKSNGESTMMCDDCYSGVNVCVDCRDEWMHSDVGCMLEYDYIDDDNDYHCNSCAEYEGTCADCGEDVGKENLQNYSYSEWENNRKKHYDRELCENCYEERNPSIDPQEIAEGMTEDVEEQEEIAEAIQNNMDTHGTIWKQLRDATMDEKWEIIRIMGFARSRHEDTDYDNMLRHGIDKDTARELIKI